MPCSIYISDTSCIVKVQASRAQLSHRFLAFTDTVQSWFSSSLGLLPLLFNICQVINCRTRAWSRRWCKVTYSQHSVGIKHAHALFDRTQGRCWGFWHPSKPCQPSAYDVFSCGMFSFSVRLGVQSPRYQSGAPVYSMTMRRLSKECEKNWGTSWKSARFETIVLRRKT